MLRYDRKRSMSISKLLMMGIIFTLLFIGSKVSVFLEIVDRGELLEVDFILNLFYDLITADNYIITIPVVSSLMYSASFVEELDITLR